MNNTLFLLQLYSEWGINETLSPLCTNHLQNVKQIARDKKTKKISLSISDEKNIPLQDIKIIEDLKQIIQASKKNPLYMTAMNTVLPEGNPQSPFFVIGEVPDAEEDRSGQVFSGQSGTWLTQMFDSIGINISSCFRMPLIPWRPPGGRSPSKEELAYCMPFVFKALEICKPSLVISLGLLPARILTGSTSSIGQLAGNCYEFAIPNVDIHLKLFSLRHPLQLNTSVKIKQHTWKNLLQLRKLIENQ
ncbi:hypothetical protein COMNV_00524 [Commensalibacter sp. Nvir]|uniref:uracil-DNA glycosylase n=1 Tax=Commensalibacter sp. Nvir TaxID=3069817 RepID=UPI002D70320E|nr:hypothetical protein COMNV_00524 [Commensalibacter sp. Nvir]